MKEIFKILIELFRIFRRTYLEVKRKKNEKEIMDVRQAIQSIDINDLRDSILGYRTGDK